MAEDIAFDLPHLFALWTRQLLVIVVASHLCGMYSVWSCVIHALSVLIPCPQLQPRARMSRSGKRRGRRLMRIGSMSILSHFLLTRRFLMVIHCACDSTAPVYKWLEPRRFGKTMMALTPHTSVPLKQAGSPCIGVLSGHSLASSCCVFGYVASNLLLHLMMSR